MARKRCRFCAEPIALELLNEHTGMKSWFHVGQGARMGELYRYCTIQLVATPYEDDESAIPAGIITPRKVRS